MENKIAVIIPAYKDTYLLNTLISINNQTDKKFNLYICNDSSPYYNIFCYYPIVY